MTGDSGMIEFVVALFMMMGMWSVACVWRVYKNERILERMNKM